MKVATKLIGINALPLLWFIGGAKPENQRLNQQDSQVATNDSAFP